MGGFQAIASGIGQTAEQMGQGANDALNEALKVRAQLHSEQMDTSHLALAQALQKQNWDLAQQQHELSRQQIIQQGWKDMGLTVDPSTGGYTRTFYNDASGQTSRVPIQGTPPDSPAALIAYYKNLREMHDDSGTPMFTDLQAKQLAFKMPQLYREGPVGMMEGFKDYARELSESGMSKVKSSTGKQVDLSTPEGQQAFAQDQLDLIYGRSGFFRWGAGNAANGKDMTGWTPGETREYNGLAAGVKNQEQLLERMAVVQMQNTLDPTAQQAIQQRLVEQLSQLNKPLDDKYAEISNRHHGAIPFTMPPGAPDPTHLQDDTLYKNKATGQTMGKVQGGKWVAP